MTIKIQRYATVLAWSLSATFFMLLSSSAQALGAVSQAFSTPDTSLVPGTIVTIQSGKENVVEKATSSSAPQLLGVTAAQPLVALGGGDKEVQVVISGQTSTLVSNVNGDVKVGDKITASPIEGVGMKAVNSAEIVGTAESNLSDGDTTTETVKDKTGKSTEVKIGLIAVQVNVSYYVAPQSRLSNIIPSFLVNVGSSIAGRDVSPLRILIGFCSLIVGFVIAGIMLQAGVRSGIISLGRNPLASGVLRRSMLDVLATSLGLLAIAIIAFYLVLTT